MKKYILLTILILFTIGCLKERNEAKDMIALTQAIEIAKHKAVSLDYDVENMKVVADEENSQWDVFVASGSLEHNPHIKDILNGKEFWVIALTPTKPHILGGILLVFVDKSTGEIVLALPLK